MSSLREEIFSFQEVLIQVQRKNRGRGGEDKLGKADANSEDRVATL